jgi:hypothetical protein
MIEFNPLYDSYDTVIAIRTTAMNNLAAGIIITEFASEGTQFKGVLVGDTMEILLATERYLDQYNGDLITETRPNFNTY